MKIEKFKVEEWFNTYEKDAVYDLADTCVESLTINELLELTNGDGKEIFSKKLDYGAILGTEKLRRLISSLYENQSNENITITHGAIGANQLVLLSLIERGDKVVTIVPTYQQHYSIPESIGADVKMLFLKEEDKWLPNIDNLAKVVGKDTKIICLNNPNNPTGAVIPRNMLLKIVQIAKKSNAYILSDEVYRGLNHEGEPFVTSIADIYDRGISTSSMSKVFSLAGLRLGWICANKDIIDVVNRHRQYNTISVGILDDYFATLAIENKDKIIQRNLTKINYGKKILIDWANRNKRIHLVEPKGGTTACVR